MRRLSPVGLAALLLLPAAAHAHFIWLVPADDAGGRLKVIFSDDLKPDKAYAKRSAHVARTEFRMRDAAGKVSPLKLGKGEEFSGSLEVPGEGFRVVGGKTRWGVHVLKERNEKTPFLIWYYPKVVLGKAPDKELARPWDWLDADIVSRVEGGKLHLRVLYKGEPAPRTEVRVLYPGEKDLGAYRTNSGGELKVPLKGPGTYGVWSRAGVELVGGEHEGSKYDEVRHYASLVLHVDASQAKAGGE